MLDTIIQVRLVILSCASKPGHQGGPWEEVVGYQFQGEIIFVYNGGVEERVRHEGLREQQRLQTSVRKGVMIWRVAGAPFPADA